MGTVLTNTGSILFASSFLSSDAVAPITYSAVGLPNGLTINANTGEVTGVPIANATGTMSIVATDATGSKQTLGLPYKITGIVAPDPIVTSIQGLQSIYVSNMSAAAPTSSNYEKAAYAYFRIVELIIDNPKKVYMDYLTSWMIMYKDSLFKESIFVVGANNLQSQQRSLVMDVYTAWRNITATPTLPISTTALASHTGCVPLVTYVLNYKSPTSSGNQVVQVSPGGAASTIALTSVAGVNGNFALTVGATAYEVALSGATTLSFVKDVTLTYPTTDFGVSSDVILTLNGHGLTLDGSVKMSTDGARDAQNIFGVSYSAGNNAVLTLEGTTVSKILLKVGSFDGGITWTIYKIDTV